MNVATSNKLSQEDMDSLSLSPERVNFLLEWYGEMWTSQLKGEDDRQKDCNYISIADVDNGKPVARFEVWYNMVKAEAQQVSMEALIKVVDGLGDDHDHNETVEGDEE